MSWYAKKPQKRDLSQVSIYTLIVMGLILAVSDAILDNGVSCFGILGMIGGGRRMLDREFSWTKYLARAEFAVFLMHQTAVVAIGYFIVRWVASSMLGWLLITLSSAALTFLLYELGKRFRLTRLFLSIK